MSRNEEAKKDAERRVSDKLANQPKQNGAGDRGIQGETCRRGEDAERPKNRGSHHEVRRTLNATVANRVMQLLLALTRHRFSPAVVSFQKLPDFGAKSPLGRPGQPVELAPIYALLASQESSYVTGETYGVTGRNTLP